ncbi:MAG TPA: PKD domain-containing protein, partial [Clostridia bacterium]|nr:PKD domain-containing protein [Clostridia bacterium]
NTASSDGGGAGSVALLMSCALALNRAATCGGAYNCTLSHCTVVSNSASRSLTAGVNFCRVSDSILYFNTAKADPVYGTTFEDVGGSAHCDNVCQPIYRSYIRGITNNPQLLDLWHIAATSPCRAAGTNVGNLGFLDLDKEPWSSPPAIGCDEVSEAALVGPLSVSVTGWPEVAAGGAMPLTANITGSASFLHWNFGDGVVVSNASYITFHVWTNVGNYTVTATAFNNDNPAGVTATFPVRVVPLEAPLLTNPIKEFSSFSLQVNGQPGVTYELQTATNLIPPVNWERVSSLTSTGVVTIRINPPYSDVDMRLYRLQVQ